MVSLAFRGWIAGLDSGLDDCVQLDFHAPLRIEKLSDDDHGSRRADVFEELAVNAAYGLPVVGVGEVDAGADDVFEGRAAAGEDFCGDFEDAASLGFYVCFICADWAGAGDVDGVANAHGAGEADDGLEGGASGKVLAGHDREERNLRG